MGKVSISQEIASPDCMNILNNLCYNAGVILSAVHLSIFAEMPSRPLALDVSRDSSISYTSSSVHKKSSGQLPTLGSSYLLESGAWLGHIQTFGKVVFQNCFELDGLKFLKK